MSHFSCFFFRKRRNKRNQTEREKRRKATAVSLGVLENRLFRITCSARFSSLRRDCGYDPRPQIRQYRICWSVQMVGSHNRSLSTRRKNGNSRLLQAVLVQLLSLKRSFLQKYKLFVVFILKKWYNRKNNTNSQCQPARKDTK